MNEKFNKNAKVEQLTKVVLSNGEEKGLIVKDPYFVCNNYLRSLMSMGELYDVKNTVCQTIITLITVFAWYHCSLIPW